jgi:hypothetical protein
MDETPVAQLIGSIDRLGPTKDLSDLESVVPLVRAVLADRRLPSKIVDFELAQILSNPMHVPLVRQGALYINRNDRGEMGVVLSRTSGEGRPHPTFLASDPAHYLVGAIDAPLYVIEYQQRATDASLFDAATPLGEELIAIVSPGDVLILPATMGVRLIFSEIPAWMLRVTQSPSKQFMWQYEMSAKRPVRSICSETKTTRLELTLKLLAQCGSSNVEVIAPLLEHPSHHIRWQAATTLAVLNEKAGWSAIESMKRDSHPHVRAAAERSFLNLTIALEQGNG